MMRINGRAASQLLVAAAAFTVFGCSDHQESLAPAVPRVPQAQTDISDGAHGGNPNVFLLPPLARLPIGQPGFGGTFQGGLPLHFRIRDMTSPGTPVFKEIPTNAVVSSNLLQAYISAWDTRNPRTVHNYVYRVEVLIASKVVAFVDVKLVDDLHGVILGTGDPVVLPQTLLIPLAVRVQKGWNCTNQSGCATETVPSTIPPGQKVIVVSPDGNNSLAFTGTWNNSGGPVVVTIEDVTSQLAGSGGCKQSFGVVLSQEHCVQVTTDPAVVLTAPVTIGTCLANPGDSRQLLLKYGVNETPTVLSDAPPPVACPTRIGSMRRSANPLVRLAAAAMSGLGGIVGVKPAYAFDVGPGATIDAGMSFSYFSPTFPVQMSLVSGDNQNGLTAPTPSDFVVSVAYVHNVGQGGQSPIDASANVTCLSTGAAAVNNNDGTYTCPHPAFPFGTNTFKVAIAGEPDQVPLSLGNGQSMPLNQSVTFHATGTSDGFEALSSWTWQGFWNRNTLSEAANTAYPTYVALAPNDNSGGHLPAPFAGAWATWYGQQATGNYLGVQAANDLPGSGGTSATRNTGQFVSPTFQIPAGLNSVSLSFETWWEIEGVNPSGFDLMEIAIKDVDANTVTQLGTLNPANDPDPDANFPMQPLTSAGYNLPPAWTVAGADLTAFAGKNVQLIFTFDTGDERYNGFRGWLIDNVSLNAGGGALFNIVSSGNHHLGPSAKSIGLNPPRSIGTRRTQSP